MIERRRFGEARVLLDQAFQRYGSTCRLLAAYGELENAVGDRERALYWYRRAVRADSAAAAAWSGLAEVQYSLSHFASAESSYAAAARTDRSGRAFVNLGIFQLRRGELARAESAFVAAGRKLGENAELLYNEACLEAIRGRHEKAITLLDRAARSGLRGAAAIAADPDLAALRTRPGYEAFAARVRSSDASAPRRPERQAPAQSK